MITRMKNKYIIRSRISEAKFREILRYFCLDMEATIISNLTGISKNSLGKIFKEIRILMANECEKISKFSGEIEIDESYFVETTAKAVAFAGFGAKRVRGKRGRGASGKTRAKQIKNS